MKISKRKFTKIYNQQIEKIYRFVFVKVSTSEIAQDITAQVFTKGWKKFSAGANIENPTAYLYQIARTEIAGHFRKKSKFQIISTDSVVIADPSQGQEAVQSQKSDIEIVKASLGQLKQNYQNVLIWRYIDQMPIKKIAQIMKKNPGAIRALLHRALKELRGKCITKSV